MEKKEEINEEKEEIKDDSRDELLRILQSVIPRRGLFFS
jgi:hypothetical protein